MAISEFQLALIGTGAVAVVGVWAYNSWQEYRQRKAAERIFSGTQEDVLASDDREDEAQIDTPAFVRAATPRQEPRGESRTEPRFEPRMEPRFEPRFAAAETERLPADETAVSMTEATTAYEDGFDEPVLAGPASDQREVTATEPPEEFADPMIEAVIALPPALNVATMRAHKADNDFRKRVRWVACESGVWREVDTSCAAEANCLHAAIQLADRQGSIDPEELSVFCRMVETMVVANGERGFVFPPLDETLAHARAMDDLCASVDIQIALHIVSRSGQAFAGTKLRGLLEASGLALADDGLFYLSDAEGRRLLSVCNSGAVPFDMEQMRTGTTADITFWLDVPRVGNGDAVFDIMLSTARQLAEALDGMLVDDQRNPLSDSALAVIRAKVVELQTQMAAHGIPAGGRRALRLFS